MVLAFGENVSVISLIRFLIIIYGAYSLVTVGRMKRNGEISQWLLSASELPRVRDKEGFCEMMSRPTFVFGLSCIGFGLISLVNSHYIGNEVLHFVLLAAFFVCIVWYVSALRRAKKRFIY
ncbi:MAG: hypothetical protein IJ108_04930 [Eubacterium sp.]|nr:hypothetical protein [Eubacterium sp.]